MMTLYVASSQSESCTRNFEHGEWQHVDCFVLQRCATKSTRDSSVCSRCAVLKHFVLLLRRWKSCWQCCKSNKESLRMIPLRACLQLCVYGRSCYARMPYVNKNNVPTMGWVGFNHSICTAIVQPLLPVCSTECSIPCLSLSLNFLGI